MPPQPVSPPRPESGARPAELSPAARGPAAGGAAGRVSAEERAVRELLARAGVEVGGTRPCDIRIHDPRTYRRVVRDAELGLGESYQEGWWDANALDAFIAAVQTADLRRAFRPGPSVLLLAARGRLRNRQSARRARRNARAHYDIGGDLYERMLDRCMVYSCAYWRGASCLDEAQEAKLDLVCRKLALEPGMRVLDVGCGWGGFAHFAAERYGAHVTGISPAGEQVRLARERCKGLPVEIRQEDYRRVSAQAGSFDRIVSIGMLEHVGARNHRVFFERCRALLAPDGIMLHQTIGSNETKGRTDPWFDRYVFPGGVLPSMLHLARAAEGDWVIEDVHNFGPDYDATLMAWHDNIDRRWHELPWADERFRRTWRYYLLASAGTFRARALQLYQIVFRRARRCSGVYAAPR